MNTDTAFFGLLAITAFADGHVDDDQVAKLTEFCRSRKMKVSSANEYARQTLARFKDDPGVADELIANLAANATAQDKQSLIEKMFEIASTDKELADGEVALMKKCADCCGVAAWLDEKLRQDTGAPCPPCSGCRATLVKAAKYCPQCGLRVVRKPRCPYCSTAYLSAAKFCIECGAHRLD